MPEAICHLGCLEVQCSYVGSSFSLFWSSVVVTEWTMSSSRDGGSWEGTAVIWLPLWRCWLVWVLRNLRSIFPLFLPIVFTSLSVRPLRENRRRCSAFGLLSQQLVSYSGSCKLQFFSPVKPTHTAIHFYLSLMWRLWRNNSEISDCLEDGGS